MDRQDKDRIGHIALWAAVLALAAALLFAAVCPTRAQPADGRARLVVHVMNVSPRGGVLRLGLYDAAGYPDDQNPVASADVPASSGETVIALDGIAPGTYAIEAYQDINGNDRMDKSWIGLPLEPYGFSRDARPVLSKPDFSRVRFVLNPGTNGQVVHLRNSDAPGR